MTVGSRRQDGASLEATVRLLASHLQTSRSLGAGDLAELRRMDPHSPGPAYFKLEGLVLDDQLPGDEAERVDLETRWAAIIVGLALLGDLHCPPRRLGTALAEAQYSEVRFAKLIRADAERLTDELPMLARFLAARGVAADWTSAARLILSADRPDYERHRRNLARDYYGVVARNDVHRD